MFRYHRCRFEASFLGRRLKYAEKMSHYLLTADNDVIQYTEDLLAGTLVKSQFQLVLCMRLFKVNVTENDTYTGSGLGGVSLVMTILGVTMSSESLVAVIHSSSSSLKQSAGPTPENIMSSVVELCNLVRRSLRYLVPSAEA